jgi:hypothetical protein
MAENFGIAIVARIPMTTTTMSSSISVKPLRSSFIEDLIPGRVAAWGKIRQPTRRYIRGPGGTGVGIFHARQAPSGTQATPHGRSD